MSEAKKLFDTLKTLLGNLFQEITDSPMTFTFLKVVMNQGMLLCGPIEAIEDQFDGNIERVIILNNFMYCNERSQTSGIDFDR